MHKGDEDLVESVQACQVRLGVTRQGGFGQDHEAGCACGVGSEAHVSRALAAEREIRRLRVEQQLFFKVANGQSSSAASGAW